MSKFFSRRWERRFIILAGVILVVSISFFVLVALSIGPSYIIRINNEPWYVTGTKAVQEFGYSNTYFIWTGERTIMYPGLAYDKYLEINLTVVSGSLDLSVESAGEILFESSNASEAIVTLSIVNNQVSITESPFWTNVTLRGYIKAYCWIPISLVPSYYFRSIFGGA